MEHILSKFTDHNKRGQNTDTLKSSSIFQKGLSRLEKWADRDFMQVKGNCQVLHAGQSKSVQQDRCHLDRKQPWLKLWRDPSKHQAEYDWKCVIAWKVSSCILSYLVSSSVASKRERGKQSFLCIQHCETASGAQHLASESSAQGDTDLRD